MGVSKSTERVEKGMKPFWIYSICVAAMCVIAFAACGLDKWKAKKGRWRVPEKVLFLLAALGGAWGFLTGMVVFRHQDEPLVLPDRGAGAFFALDGGDRGTDLENGALKDFDGKPLRKEGGCGILKPVCPKPQGK